MKLLFIVLIYIKQVYSINNLNNKCKNLIFNKEELINLEIPKNSINMYENALIHIKFYYIYDSKKNNLNTNDITNNCQTQIDNLNQAFNKPDYKTNIYFKFYNLEFINNKKFAKDCDKKEKEYKKSYYLDPTKYINVYICPDKNYLGWAYFPNTFIESDFMNGVVIHPETLPGSKNTNYNQGHTLTHELGHFFGLSHTFNYFGICSTNGDDGISDTPIQKSPSYECNYEKDSCPNYPGKDPVWNYMDYSFDRCLTHFSLEQIKQMRHIFYIKKKKLFLNSIENYKLEYPVVCRCKKRGRRITNL